MRIETRQKKKIRHSLDPSLECDLHSKMPLVFRVVKGRHQGQIRGYGQGQETG